jgi:ribosomal protein S18 acetylase RimI-like enzyme
MSDLLADIEAYYDAVPRHAADVETLGPFTLFVKRGSGWPYYARPTLGATSFAASDVVRVRERQRTLGVPEAFEWVAETSPGLRMAVEAAGLAAHDHPLMVLDDARTGRRPAAPNGVVFRFVAPEDDVGLIGAVGHVAFARLGTEVGPEGTEALAASAAGRTADEDAFLRERLRAGLTVTAAALVDGQPVAIGTHQPVGAVTEVAGVATLPSFRRRGIGVAITDLLVQDALRRGVRTVFLSAADDAVARIYGRVGFRRIATACIAEPLTPSTSA